MLTTLVEVRTRNGAIELYRWIGGVVGGERHPALLTHECGIEPRFMSAQRDLIEQFRLRPDDSFKVAHA